MGGAAPARAASAEASARAQGGRGIHARGPERREQRASDGDQHQDDDDSGRAPPGPRRVTPKRSPRKTSASTTEPTHARRGPGQHRRQVSAEHQPHDVRPVGADGHPHAELAGPLDDAVGDHAEDAHRGEHAGRTRRRRRAGTPGSGGGTSTGAWSSTSVSERTGSTVTSGTAAWIARRTSAPDVRPGSTAKHEADRVPGVLGVRVVEDGRRRLVERAERLVPHDARRW